MQFVYALVDERDNSVGYVGITNDPNVRYAQHLDLNDKNVLKIAWLRERLILGIIPIMKILEIVDTRKQAEQRERFWIQYFTEQGMRLTNKHKIRGLYVHDEDLVIGPLNLENKTSRNTFVRAFALENEIYGKEAFEETMSFCTYIPSWQRKNIETCWYLGLLTDYESEGASDEVIYSDAWATFCLLPLKEEVILAFLQDNKGKFEISSDLLLPWNIGQSYSCYIPTTAYRPGKERYLALLFQKAIVQLVARYGITIERIYTRVTDGQNETPLLRFVKEHCFVPAPEHGKSSWTLHLDRFNPSLAIQAYQKAVAESVMP